MLRHEEGWERYPYGVAERVGVYQFESEEEAALAYLDRMTQAGVPLREGGCESSWIPGDGMEMYAEGSVEYRGELYFPQRYGCFINENGIANIRLTCWGGTYIGILGRDGNLGRLDAWTWFNPPYVPADTPSPPGICFGPDGLIGPDTQP